MNVLDISLQNNYSYKKVLTPAKSESAQPKQVLHSVDTNNKKVRNASFIGSGIGIAASVAVIYALKKRKNPNISLKNLRYNEKDILMLGAGSVIGGLAGGLLTDKEQKNKIPKYREASLQFFGSLLCPVGVLAVANKILETTKFQLPLIKSNSKAAKCANVFISALPKITATFGSLIIGMHIGNKIMNKVNNKIFNQNENREVHASDYLVHFDDACVATSLLLKDSKAISAITSKALPVSFILAGANAGMKEA